MGFTTGLMPTLVPMVAAVVVLSDVHRLNERATVNSKLGSTPSKQGHPKFGTWPEARSKWETSSSAPAPTSPSHRSRVPGLKLNRNGLRRPKAAMGSSPAIPLFTNGLSAGIVPSLAMRTMAPS